jgi:queuosine precursor transporter
VVAFFVVMTQFLAGNQGIETSAAANLAIQTLFAFAPRIFVGSIAAYVVAQYVNIVLYNTIARWTNNRFLWLRINGANIVAQLVDSTIFFSIVFFNLEVPLIVQAVLVGWAVKVFVVALGTPLLYLDLIFPQRRTP